MSSLLFIVFHTRAEARKEEKIIAQTSLHKADNGKIICLCRVISLEFPGILHPEGSIDAIALDLLSLEHNSVPLSVLSDSDEQRIESFNKDLLFNIRVVIDMTWDHYGIPLGIALKEECLIRPILSMWRFEEEFISNTKRKGVALFESVGEALEFASMAGTNPAIEAYDEAP